MSRFGSAAKKRADHRRVVGKIDRGFVTVANADAAPQVDVLESDAFAGERVDQLQELRRRLAVRLEGDDLRTDVDVDATQRDGRAALAARRYSGSASAKAMPNLLSFSPVAM